MVSVPFFLSAATFSLIADGAAPVVDIANAPIAPPVREIAPGRYEVGGVTLDKTQRNVSFDASVNMIEGEIEYLIVAERGKTHESLFRTAIEPYHLHVAMLLLGVHNPADDPPPEGPPATLPGNLDSKFLQSAPPLTGDRVSLIVTWTVGGKEKKTVPEDLINNAETKTSMTQGPWLYTGSLFQEGTFVAQRDRSVASIISDPGALINNPRRGNDNDRIWSPRTAKLPPVNTPVRITIHFAPPPDQPDTP